MFNLCKELLAEDIRTVDVVSRIQNKIKTDAEHFAKAGLEQNATKREVVSSIVIHEQEYMDDENFEDLNRLFDHINKTMTESLFECTSTFLKDSSNRLDSKYYSQYIPGKVEK